MTRCFESIVRSTTVPKFFQVRSQTLQWQREFKPTCRRRLFQILKQIQFLSSKCKPQWFRPGQCMQAPIGPKLISTVTIHTHLFVMLKIGKLNNLQHETTQVSQLFYLLHLENQARKLQTPNLILLFLLSATAVPNSHFFCFQLLGLNRFNKSCL